MLNLISGIHTHRSWQGLKIPQIRPIATEVFSTETTGMNDQKSFSYRWYPRTSFQVSILSYPLAQGPQTFAECSCGNGSGDHLSRGWASRTEYTHFVSSESLMSKTRSIGPRDSRCWYKEMLIEVSLTCYLQFVPQEHPWKPGWTLPGTFWQITLAFFAFFLGGLERDCCALPDFTQPSHPL